MQTKVCVCAPNYYLNIFQQIKQFDNIYENKYLKTKEFNKKFCRNFPK